jgi:predicted membrane protein
MYGWLWKRLPGSVWIKCAIATVAAVVLVAILFLWVFPWAAPLLPFDQQTVGG